MYEIWFECGGKNRQIVCDSIHIARIVWDALWAHFHMISKRP